MALSMGLLGGAAYRNGDYELISTTVLGSNVTSVTFSNSGLWSAYKHLQIRASARSSNTGTGNDGLWLQFNGDAASNYAWHRLEGNGSTANSAAGTSATWMLQGLATRASQDANIFSSTIIDIVDHSNSSKNKTIRSLNGVRSAANPSIALNSGLWLNAAALTSLAIKPDNGYSFTVDSRFSLYGIRG